MKVAIKEIDTPKDLDQWTTEYLISCDKTTIAICFTEEDAKFVAKCIRKYKNKKRK